VSAEGQAGSRGASRKALEAARRPGERKAVGLFRADSEAQLEGPLGDLPLSGWMPITGTPLEPHPNDPASTRVP
jgi:muconolactone D-isomerase